MLLIAGLCAPRGILTDVRLVGRGVAKTAARMISLAKLLSDDPVLGTRRVGDSLREELGIALCSSAEDVLALVALAT